MKDFKVKVTWIAIVLFSTSSFATFFLTFTLSLHNVILTMLTLSPPPPFLATLGQPLSLGSLAIHPTVTASDVDLNSTYQMVPVVGRNLRLVTHSGHFPKDIFSSRFIAFMTGSTHQGAPNSSMVQQMESTADDSSRLINSSTALSHDVFDNVFLQ